jgi:hypothetical protein
MTVEADNKIVLDPAANAVRRVSLRTLITSDKMAALKDLLPSDAGEQIGKSPGDSPDYYAQLWAMMLYIRSKPMYRGGLERLMSDAATGRLRPALNVPPEMGSGKSYNSAVALPVFQQYITANLATFEAEYRAYAVQLAGLSHAPPRGAQ